MSKRKWISCVRKLKPYNIVKGVRYLRHFGWKEFLTRLSERMEPEKGARAGGAAKAPMEG